MISPSAILCFEGRGECDVGWLDCLALVLGMPTVYFHTSSPSHTDPQTQWPGGSFSYSHQSPRFSELDEIGLVLPLAPQTLTHKVCFFVWMISTFCLKVLCAEKSEWVERSPT